MKYIITVLDNDELKSVHSSEIPATISKYLEAAVDLALEVAETPSPIAAPKITIGISPETRERLALLDALEAAGVDNWDGYDEAIASMGEDEAEGAESDD